MFLLDTDIIIYSFKGLPEVIENLQVHTADPKAISVITYGELVYGAEKSQHVAKNLAKVRNLREIFPVVEITCSIMDTFGMIKADLSKKGTIIDDFDLLIGSTALTLGYTIVSNNEKHFNNIPDLQVTNWTKSI